VLWWRKTAAAALRTESVAGDGGQHLQRLRPGLAGGDPIQHEHVRTPAMSAAVSFCANSTKAPRSPT